MVKSCAAYNCNERFKKGKKNLSFHQFPTNPELRMKWIIATKRPNFNPSKYTYLCSKHFVDSCFNTERLGGLIILKKDAVPTLFEYDSSDDDESSISAKRVSDAIKTEIADSNESSTSYSQSHVLFPGRSDFNNICRLCMLSCDIMFARDNVISDVFYKLTDIHFEVNNELPQQICLNCFDKINEIHEFILQCKQTHACLLKCIDNFKNSQMYEERETLEKINEPFKTKEEITIDEHEIDFYKDEVINSTSEYVIDDLKLKEEIEEDKYIKLEENMIQETSVDQYINCSEDVFSNRNTANI